MKARIKMNEWSRSEALLIVLTGRNQNPGKVGRDGLGGSIDKYMKEIRVPYSGKQVDTRSTSLSLMAQDGLVWYQSDGVKTLSYPSQDCKIRLFNARQLFGFRNVSEERTGRARKHKLLPRLKLINKC